MNLIVVSLITLGVTGCLAAIILYVAAQKFKVFEDPRIEQVEALLPGANCGGCGFPGCHGFAEGCVKAETMEGLLCPVGGQPTMEKVAEVLGRAAVATEPMVAVVRCNGTCANRPRTTEYNGSKNCQIVANLYAGETGCSYGCLGYGGAGDVCACCCVFFWYPGRSTSYCRLCRYYFFSCHGHCFRGVFGCFNIRACSFFFCDGSGIISF